MRYAALIASSLIMVALSSPLANASGAGTSAAGNAAIGVNASAQASESSGCFSAGTTFVSAPVFTAAWGGPFKSLSTNIQSAAMAMSVNVQPYGLALGGGFALLAMMLDVGLAMTKRQSVLEAIVPSIIIALTAAVLVKNYASLVNFFVGTVKDIEVAVTGETDPFSMLFQTFYAIFLNVVHGMGLALNSACGFPGFFTHIGEFLLIGFVGLLTAFALAYAFIEIVGVALLPLLMIGIGIAVGPLFVGLLGSRWTQKWALKWIEFMIAALLINLFVLVGLKLLSETFGSMSTNAANAGATALSMFGLLIMSLALGKIFSSIPGMANAMVPGHSGISGAGGGNAAAAAQMAANSKAAGGGIGGGGGGGSPIPASVPGTIGAMAKVAAAAIGGTAAVHAVESMGTAVNTAGSAVKGAAGKIVGGGAKATPPQSDSSQSNPPQ